MKIDPEDMLTIKNVMKMFGVGQMTIWVWRNKHEMPVILIPGNDRNNVRFDKPSVVVWAKEHNKEIKVDVPTPKEKSAKTTKPSKPSRPRLQPPA